jgi:hypothetical protein
LEVLLNNVFRNISIILTIKLTTQKVSLLLRLITPEGKPHTITGRPRRVLLSKVLANRNSLTHSEFKITVNMANGQIYLISPAYALASPSHASLATFVLHITKVLKRNLENLYGPVSFAFDTCGEARASVMDQPDERMRRLLYYSQFTSVALNLPLDPTTSDERTRNLKHQKEVESIQLLKTSYLPLSDRNGL